MNEILIQITNKQIISKHYLPLVSCNGPVNFKNVGLSFFKLTVSILSNLDHPHFIVA